MKDKKFDVVALGELLIDFTQNGISQNGNWMLEAKSWRRSVQCSGDASKTGAQNFVYRKSRR